LAFFLGLGIGISRATALAGTETSVVALSFADNSLVIRDPTNPANNYNGALISNGAFNKFTYTRASTALYLDFNGLIRTAASGAPRIEYDPVTLAVKGYLAEGARTNLCLWSNDQSNAAYTKTNMTAVQNQVGPDGLPNSASLLTATAANGTCLQAITAASQATAQSAYIKQITGSGVINMTMDNGVTWTVVTATSLWTKVRIPSQTLANPTVGFRIVTSGDAIAVAYCQTEPAAWDSSPIPTTTVAVTRAADFCSLAGTAFNLTQTVGTMYVKNTWQGGTSVSAGLRGPITAGDGTANEYHSIYNPTSIAGAITVDGGVAQTTPSGSSVANDIFSKTAYAYALNDFSFVQNAGAPVVSSVGTLPTTTSLAIGVFIAASLELNGTIQETAFTGRRVPNVAMQSVTT
jgi:hypothetical protein